MKYRTIDICSGIGGIRKGFEKTDHFENILSAENDEYAARTYEHLYGDDPRADLTSDEFKEKVKELEYDILLAGFPCQPFSSQGHQEGFEDLTKGTIFFHIEQIIKDTRPKVVFLENVQNIISHDNRRTIRIIIDTLEKKLNYKVIGVTYDEDGNCLYNKNSFVRNTRNFGLPQNRPRAYFVAFDRELYGKRLDIIQNELPTCLPEYLSDDPNLNKTLNDILDSDVSLHYYMSATYLDTLEKHTEKQKKKGNGFGYYVLNDRAHRREYANTIMATGGSGKERNLIIQKMPKHTRKEAAELNKKGGLNKKNIRIMTPEEWGRLQGFIGYGFLDNKTGKDKFSFPTGMPESQKYKQFGNSVSIPVIEAIADFIFKQLNILIADYGYVLCNYAKQCGFITRSSVSNVLRVEPSKASYILKRLSEEGLISSKGTGRTTKYFFK